MQLLSKILIMISTLSPALAQFPEPPVGVTTLQSQLNANVTLSFKEVEICQQSPSGRSYSGFVHLPGDILSDIGGFDINSYFVYFQARHNASTAPLVIYLAGGPGESSTYAALSSESGPCYVNINGTDTINNPWSFNEYANVLYIDQPAQTGFSYSELINGTFNLLDGTITPFESSQETTPNVNASFGYGTYSNQQPEETVNTTVQAAKALWYFTEHWLSSFPAYNTSSGEISVWGNSYGGYWVPETAVQFSRQLANLSSSHPLTCRNFTIDSVGITNGCIDILSAMLGYPDFAYNNTYGVSFASESEYDAAITNFTMAGGCQELISLCRSAGEVGDPDFTGSNATVNELCMEAFYFCETNVIGPFPELNERDAFDVAILQPSQCPYYLPVHWYLNQASIQQELGVSLNYTVNANTVLLNFGLAPPDPNRPLSTSTGDAARQNGLPNIEYLLANGVKVAFIFGDRDYRCPWTGGEATALSASWQHQDDFASAGYEQLQGIETPVDQGGLRAVVKQYGTFSFSRVLDAGHSVSAYAPETVYRIFERTLKGVDVVTGTQLADSEYHTNGPKDSWGWKNQLPEDLPPTCMVEGQFQTENPWQLVASGVD